MIIGAGLRTDLVHHYGEWLMNRFHAGFAYVRNPLFPNRVHRFRLDPDVVDAVLFCSKNYAPFLDGLGEIEKRYRLYCHYTITAYEHDVEPGIPSLDERVETLLRVEKIVGKGRLAWRYDPVLLTENYTIDRHLDVFERLARQLAGHVDRCIFSFVEMYVKLRTNMPELIPLTNDDKQKLAKGLGAIAKSYRLPLQICCNEADYSEYGIRNAACVTLDVLGKANGCTFRSVKHNGNRRGCGCIETRDLGLYDTCPNGCKYCYATRNPEAVRANMARHDPESPLLIGKLEPWDTLIEGAQHSFLKTDGSQLSFFD